MLTKQKKNGENCVEKKRAFRLFVNIRSAHKKKLVFVGLVCKHLAKVNDFSCVAFIFAAILFVLLLLSLLLVLLIPDYVWFRYTFFFSSSRFCRGKVYESLRDFYIVNAMRWS